ncbi:hypothetical protein ABT300_21285 [Streptomyces sp. NPDC001027]|uniref:hypothetical protein n=1 Tax=Streptomyces sp. NPDC001027 TaxID=3154771 RepID=UPI0033336DDA
MTTWQELQAEVADRLAAVSAGERVVFAVGVAERLMRVQEALPAPERAEYAVGLRPMLNALWEGALGNASAFGEIKHGLGEHLLSEYCHNDGQAGPGDAHEPAAAAVLHTAVAYLFGAGDPIRVVGGCAVEAAGERANAVAELRRQLRDLALIGRHGASLRHARPALDPDASARLHRALRVPLSTVGAADA